jgi:hypothetical protein
LTAGILPFAASQPAELFARLLPRSGYFIEAAEEKVTRSPQASGSSHSQCKEMIRSLPANGTSRSVFKATTRCYERVKAPAPNRILLNDNAALSQ